MVNKPALLGSLFTLIFLITLAYLIGQSSIYWYQDGMLMRFIGGHLLLITSYLFTLHYAIVIAQLNQLSGLVDKSEESKDKSKSKSKEEEEDNDSNNQ